MWLDKLREMKSKSGLKTNEIAVQSGIPEPTLEKLFAGTTKDPKLGTIRQLVYFLGYTLDDLEDEQEKKPTPEVGSGRDDKVLEQEFMRWFRTQTPSRQKDVLFDLAKVVSEHGE